MIDTEFQLTSLRDPRITPHAAGAHAAWLWSVDGSRVLWCNAMAAAVLGRATPEALAKPLDLADSHRRQVMQLAGRLPQSGATRLERLRGFGASLGRMATMACSRLQLPDGRNAVLMVAVDQFGRVQPLPDRLRFIVAGIAAPAAAFTPAGALTVRNDAAAAALGPAQSLGDLGLDIIRDDVLRDGKIEMPTRLGRFVLYRIGMAAETAIVAVLTPVTTFHAASEPAAVPTEALSEPAAAPPETAAPPAAIAAAVSDETLADEMLVDVDEPEQSDAAPAVTVPVISDPVVAPDSPVASHPPQHLTPPEPIVDEAFADEVLVDDDSADDLIHTPHTVAVPDREETFDESFADEILVDESPADADRPTVAAEPERTATPPAHDRDIAAQPVPTAAEDLSRETPDTAEPTPRDEIKPPNEIATPCEDTSTPRDESLTPRRHPLRFMWQMNAESRFSLGSDEFSQLVGPLTSAALGRPWHEIVEVIGIDPAGRVARAVATHDTWSGIVVDWPMDGAGHRLPVELSGLPIYDRARDFLGYRGFGVCRDLDGLDRLDRARREQNLFAPTPPAASDPPPANPLSASSTANTAPADATGDDTTVQERTLNSAAVHDAGASGTATADIQDNLRDTPRAAGDTDPVPPPPQPSSELVDIPKNVVPFRPAGDLKTPALSPVENSTFAEIARQLSARLERQAPDASGATPFEPFASAPVDGVEASELQDATELQDTFGLQETEGPQGDNIPQEPAGNTQPAWLSGVSTPPQGNSQHDQPLLDRMPVGVLIYRLDRLLYANAAFHRHTGFDSLHALTEAGGLDALFVEADTASASSTSDTGTPLTVTSPRGDQTPSEARLFTIDWDGEAAMALIFAAKAAAKAAAKTTAEPQAQPEAAVGAPVAARTEAASAPPPAQDDFSAIFASAADGILLFERSGTIVSSNRSADTLFGYPAETFTGQNLADLFATESQQVVLDYFESIDQNAATAASDHGRDVRARTRGGDVIALSMTMGRTGQDNQRFFAVFRDISQLRKHEAELLSTRQRADRATSAKSAALAKISHEIRAPLNAIIGFADVMIEQRFGPLGNERYIEYMKDIRASGERVIAIMNDMLDLSRIESGKLNLSFADQHLNEIVEQCVGVLQPRANRERIIIRTSLAHALPLIVADAAALRQIVSNLISDSIGMANAGGQVIVSTALTDDRNVVLKIRDTGHGLSEIDMATATDPFRIAAPSDQIASENGVNLALTKALVEANRAQFHIRSAPQSGTLIEVTFAKA